MRLSSGVIFLALGVLFALSNTQTVRLGVWPLDVRLELPLSIAMLLGMGMAFLAGGLTVWFGAWGQRRRLRDAEHRAQLLEAQLGQRRVVSTPHQHE